MKTEQLRLLEYLAPCAGPCPACEEQSRDARPVILHTSRKLPAPGQLVTIRGSGLGPCTFYRQHIGRSGRPSWLVIDQRCHQYHAARPDQVRVHRKKRTP